MVLNHEYLADHVSLSNRSIKDYQYRLLSIAGAPKAVALTHTFNSELKSRIIMINKKPTNRKAAWKILIIIPAVIGLSYAFVEPEYKYFITEKDPLIISEAPVIIQKGVKGIVLNEEGKPFEGVRLSNSKIPDEAFSVKTGPDGRFSMGNIQPDESIMVFTPGYKRILLKPDFNAEMTIRMEKDPQSATMPIYSNKQGDAKLPQLVVIDGVISDKDFFTASRDLGYDFGMTKMISGKEATDKYGEKGAVGVYEITTRKKAIEMGLRPPLRRLEPTDYPTFQNQQFTRFTDWVAQNAIYPEEALNKNLEGWVSVNFKVQLDGSVTDVLSNSGSVNPLLADEIIRVIKNSPKWDPPKNSVIDEPFASNTIIRFRLPDQVLNETPYVVVEQMPLYPGGDAELLKNIAKNTNYPQAAKEAKIEGRVIVRFIVTKEGNADGVSILKGVDPLLDEEAVRVVSSLKGFEPGRQGGVPVNVWYMVPITFTLPKAEIELAEGVRIMSMDGKKKPLVVVDGVITETDLNKFDSKTIESVSVLKDQPALDKYGERARDGVIEIKTKKQH
jgi:TonB family protein